MNLHAMLTARAEGGKPVRVGLIGAGKFGSMVLAQARKIKGYHIVGVADLDPAALPEWQAKSLEAKPED